MPKVRKILETQQAAAAALTYEKDKDAKDMEGKEKEHMASAFERFPWIEYPFVEQPRYTTLLL